MAVAPSLALLAIGYGIARTTDERFPFPLTNTQARMFFGVRVGAFAIGFAATNAAVEDEEGTASVLGGIVALRLAQEMFWMMVTPCETLAPKAQTTTPTAQSAPRPRTRS